MRLTKVLSGLNFQCTAGDLEVDVTGVVNDSRQVKPGSLFVCLTGTQTDGRLFVPEALRNGARAIIDHRPLTPAGGETIVQVKDTRQALAVCCANWHGNPARRLTLTGITGTDGKTTTSFFLDSILKASGAETGLVGTVLARVGDRTLPSTHTTPDPGRLHELLHLMVEAGVSHCTLEVSSHALAQERVFGIEFAVGVFTNLSHEHLEYHASLDEYLAVKSRLFAVARHAVLNRDDPSVYTRLLGAATGTVLDYGFVPDATVRGSLEETREGSILTVHHGRSSASVRLRLPGRFNASNAVAAAAAGLALGLDLQTVSEGLSRLERVPGRFQKVSLGQPFTVVVDYAHTPAALTQLLTTIRESTAGRVMLIFGARGGRDRTKRATMGAIAARLSDHCYLTLDSPNDEPPAQIIHDLESGFLTVKDHGYDIVWDRKTAMRLALERARPDDTVVATGRGHESEYRIGRETFHFDDAETFAELIQEASLRGPQR